MKKVAVTNFNIVDPHNKTKLKRSKNRKKGKWKKVAAVAEWKERRRKES